LAEMLKDKKDSARAAAAGALWMIGPPAKEASRALIGVLNDKHLGVRDQASYALEALGKDALPALLAGLQEKNEIVQGAVLELLDKLDLAGETTAVAPLL